MKPLLRLLIIFCPALFTQVSAAKKITAYIHNCTFLSARGPYVETYIDISGQSLVYTKNANGKFEASVAITIKYEPMCDSVKKDSSLIKYDKYILHSPELDDTTLIPFDLFDMKRVNLDNNRNYNIEVDLDDEAQPIIKAVLMNEVTLDYDTTGIQISDITLIDTFKKTVLNSIYTKDGYDIQPRTFNYYPSEKTKLTFYAEIYDMEKYIAGEKFLVVYSVTKSSDDDVMDNLRTFSKQTAGKENFVLASFDITNLPSGNYLLNVEVRDTANKLLADKVLYFQRSNKRPVEEMAGISKVNVTRTFAQLIPKDSIFFYLKCLLPMAETYEKQFINDAFRMYDTAIARQFIYNFWVKRNVDNPEIPFKKYMTNVYFTENEFGTRITHGFETDRGRVYLQYGKPDEREVHNGDPSALPYERWHYYSLSDHQTNIYFIFYEPDEVTNDYTLINSNATGEMQDDRWQYKIFDSYGQTNGFQNNFNTTNPNNSSSPTNFNTPH